MGEIFPGCFGSGDLGELHIRAVWVHSDLD